MIPLGVLLISVTEFILQHDDKGHFVCCVAAYEVLNASDAVSGEGAT